MSHIPGILNHEDCSSTRHLTWSTPHLMDLDIQSKSIIKNMHTALDALKHLFSSEEIEIILNTKFRNFIFHGKDIAQIVLKLRDILRKNNTVLVKDLGIAKSGRENDRICEVEDDLSFLQYMISRANHNQNLSSTKNAYCVLAARFLLSVLSESSEFSAEKLSNGHILPEKTLYCIVSRENSNKKIYDNLNIIFNTLDEALLYLKDYWRLLGRANEDDSNTLDSDFGPDAESDIILVREIIPSGHSKIVWFAYGWHFPAELYSLENGKLPGMDKSVMSQSQL